jgi:hypothetical protein
VMLKHFCHFTSCTPRLTFRVSIFPKMGISTPKNALRSYPVPAYRANRRARWTLGEQPSSSQLLYISSTLLQSGGSSFWLWQPFGLG